MCEILYEENPCDFPEVEVHLCEIPKKQSVSPIRNMQDAVHYVSSKIRRYTVENMYLILLDTKLKPLCHALVGRGNANSAIFSLTEMARITILSNAVYAICVHNHPSMDNTPSGQDDVSAKEIFEMFHMIGVSLCDFLIVGEGEPYSYSEQGRLPFR